MAKLAGFCMSALLIVLCLWINVYRYPNAFRANEVDVRQVAETDAQDDASSDAAKVDGEQSAPAESAKPTSPDAESEKTAPQRDGDGAQPADEKSEDAETIVADARPEPDAIDAKNPTSATPTATLEPAALTRELDAESPASTQDAPTPNAETASKTSLKTSSSSKPQGGKYVTIPPIETDALAPSAGDGISRVVGATRAARPLRVAAPASAR